MAYHLPLSKDSFFGPQVVYQNCGGKSIIFGGRVQTNWKHIVPIDVYESNVPIVQNSMWSEAEEKKYGPPLDGRVNFSRHCHFSDALLEGSTPTKETLDYNFSTYSKICCTCFGTTTKANLSGPQKELLVQYWRLRISMYCIQELMQSIEAHDSSRTCHEMPPVVAPIFKSTINLKTPQFVNPINFLVLSPM